MTTYYRYNGRDYADDDDLPLTLYTKHTRPALPTDLILRIVREADGGKVAHQQKFASTLNVIQGIGKYQRATSKWWMDEEGVDCPYAVPEQLNHLIKLSKQPLAWMSPNYKFGDNKYGEDWMNGESTLDYESYVGWFSGWGGGDEEFPCFRDNYSSGRSKADNPKYW